MGNAMMKAVVYYAPGDVRVEQVEVPVCGAGEIRVKIDACAVCGTDLKAYVSGNPRIKAPKVMGHEFTGLVDTVGSDVSGFEIGDRVVMATSVACGDCYYCKQGHRNLCANIAPMGFTYEGGMAEYTIIPERALKGGHAIKVPLSVPAELAALSEPLSCAVNSCFNCDVQEGDTVVVIGAGPMGILNACAARQFGASKIILAEINEKRLKQAEPFGFDLLVNPAKDDLTSIVMEQTNGIGADVVIVAAPAAKPQEDAISMVRKRGTVCLFASLPVGKSEITIDSRIIHYGEIKLVGSSDSTPEQVEKAVEIISSGSLKADKLASHVLPLDDIMKAYELMKSGEALRVVLKP
ncbi:MAG: alcohol dehydrogenase catalytic domain-containing protein [Planctomycetes bacterium]|nr:alcohol dehydrogenase catalytic domain-containing protein [Planctomycetota bacterium]